MSYNNVTNFREKLEEEENAVRSLDKGYIDNYNSNVEIEFYEKAHELMNKSDDIDDHLLEIALIKCNRAHFSPSDWRPNQIKL